MNRSKSQTPAPMSLIAALLTLLTCLLWGGNPTAARMTLDTLPPVAIAGLRFGLATIVMFVWCIITRDPLRLTRKQFGIVLVAGLLLFVQIGSFNYGVWLSNASHTSMLINTFIFWVLLLEHFITRTDKITGRKIAGMAVAAAGVAVLLLRETTASEGDAVANTSSKILGDVVLLGSAFVLAVKFIYVKYAVRHVRPGTLIFWHDVVGVALFAVASLCFEDVTLAAFTKKTCLGLLYQGVIVAGLCFALQAVLLQHHSATQIAVFSFSTPLFGVSIAIMLLGEPWTWELGVAAVSVAIGIVLVNWKSTKTQQSETQTD